VLSFKASNSDTETGQLNSAVNVAIADSLAKKTFSLATLLEALLIVSIVMYSKLASDTGRAPALAQFSKSSLSGDVVALVVSLVNCSILAGDPRHLLTIGHEKHVD